MDLESKPTGPTYWRSLQHLADSAQVDAMVDQEFPGYDPKSVLSMSRRKLLKLMGASMALAGLTLAGCRRWPKEAVAPFVSRPKNRVPGEAEYYATIFELDGVATGILANSIDG